MLKSTKEAINSKSSSQSLAVAIITASGSDTYVTQIPEHANTAVILFITRVETQTDDEMKCQ